MTKLRAGNSPLVRVEPESALSAKPSRGQAQRSAASNRVAKRDYTGWRLVLDAITDFRRLAALIVLVVDVGLFTVGGINHDNTPIYLGFALVMTLIAAALYVEFAGRASAQFSDSLGARVFNNLYGYMKLDGPTIAECLESFPAEMLDGQDGVWSEQQRAFQETFVKAFVHQARSILKFKADA